MIVTRNFAVAVAVCAAATLLRAQAPIVGDINFYGLHKVAADRILKAGKLQSGSPLPHSKGDIEDAISELPGVVLARVEAVCCEGTSTILFVGIEEKGAPHA